MKLKQHIVVIFLLGMLTTAWPSFCLARSATDSLVLNRIWSFRQNYTQSVNGVEQNVYMRYTFDTNRRNATLFLVPTMYAIAKGDRQFVGESYCKIKFRDVNDYDVKRQVVCGTIRRNRTVMKTLFQFMTPNLYDVSLYQEHLLSPFHRSNHQFYSYRIQLINNWQAILIFRPRVKNTQLVNGSALIDMNTGRIIDVSFNGEFDMIAFHVSAAMGEDIHSLLPERCITDARFRFMGNKITASFSAIYNQPTTLPDSVSEQVDRELMARLRPIPLKQREREIYSQFDLARHTADSLHADSANRKKPRLEEKAWDFIGDNLISSLSAGNGPVTVRMSPLLNPLYMSYSHTKGVSYKLNIGARYAWNTHRYLTLSPSLGYSFKQRQFYYTAPLRMTYNPKRNGYAEFTWANGNQISNPTLADAFSRQMGDTLKMPNFKDEWFQLVNNVVAYDWLEITAGLIFHRRSSKSHSLMHRAGISAEYRSFAPLVTLHITPWKKGPTLTANYERSFKGVLASNLSYERWEFDAAFKRKMHSLRVFNTRVGTGFYTKRSSNYFVDYTNFHDNNLPTGWDDEWSGQFQLLPSRWYNESSYYLRGHVSYDSPLLFLTWLPIMGHFIEQERIYVSALSIQHTRPYVELGYGFTNRYFSTGLFANILGAKVREVGCRFTVELFRRW